MRLKQGMLELPAGVSITQFMLADGKAVAKPKATATFGQLRDAYVEVRSNGSMEENTLYTTKLNLRHIEDTLGENFLLAGLARGPAVLLATLANAGRDFSLYVGHGLADRIAK